MNILQHIPEGKGKAVSRMQLRTLTGLSDRLVRKLIEDARNRGEIIINDQDGNGYYRSNDINDIRRQYRQNHARAMSILVQQKHLRRKLKEENK